MARLEPAVFDYHQRQVLPGTLVEVTSRTMDGAHHFSPALRTAIIEAIAKAQFISKIKIYAYSVMSNHYHLLASAQGPRELGKFLELFHSALGRMVNFTTGRRGRMWQRRASVVRVSDEPYTQIQRVRYILSNGVKETGLKHPSHWTGPHVAHYFANGEPETAGETNAFLQDIACKFNNFTRRYAKRKPAPKRPKPLAIQVSPLPHLDSMPVEDYRRAMCHLMDAVAQAPTDREFGMKPWLMDPNIAVPQAPSIPPAEPAPPTAPTDATQVRETTPQSRPGPKAPYFVFAHDKALRDELIEQRKQFVEAYEDASLAYRAGRRRRPQLPPHSCAPPAFWLQKDHCRSGLFARCG